MGEQKQSVRELRALERKYARLKRQAQWEAVKPKLPYYIGGAVLLAVIALLLLLLLRKPKAPDTPPALLRVDVLDVGQGDAILLRTEGHAVLIDAGDTDKGITVVQQLVALGVKELDCIINSHPHSDHFGGIETVLRVFPVHALYFPTLPEAQIPTTEMYLSLLRTAEEKQIPVFLPQCRETLSLGDAELTFLSVDNSAFEGLNDCSLGCLVTCGAHTFFFAGDLEAAGEAAFLEAGLIPRISVLKVSHHGSSSSTTEEFLAAARPQAAAISCGAMNDYGHPAAQTLKRLSDIGCTVSRTDLDGTLHYETDGVTVWMVK